MTTLVALLASAAEFLATASETGRWALVRWGLAPAPKPVCFEGLLDELFAIRPLNHDECRGGEADAELAWTGERMRLAA
jgi:hypothetical protein